MSSQGYKIVGAVVCIGGFSLLRHGVGETAGFVFACIVITAGVTAHLVYRIQLARLNDRLASFPEDEQEKLLEQIDPEIARDLRRESDRKDDA